MTDELVAYVSKNSTEVLKVAWTEYGGTRLLDVRCWTRPAVGDGAPTKKGLTLRPETWRQVMDVLARALDGEAVETDEEGYADGALGR